MVVRRLSQLDPSVELADYDRPIQFEAPEAVLQGGAAGKTTNCRRDVFGTKSEKKSGNVPSLPGLFLVYSWFIPGLLFVPGFIVPGLIGFFVFGPC